MNVALGGAQGDFLDLVKDDFVAMMLFGGMTEMAVNDATTFKGLVDVARAAMSSQQSAAG